MCDSCDEEPLAYDIDPDPTNEELAVGSKPFNPICPRCGKSLVIRVGRYGPFYGCTGFPECRFSCDADAVSPSGQIVERPRRQFNASGRSGTQESEQQSKFTSKRVRVLAAAMEQIKNIALDARIDGKTTQETVDSILAVAESAIFESGI